MCVPESWGTRAGADASLSLQLRTWSRSWSTARLVLCHLSKSSECFTSEVGLPFPHRLEHQQLMSFVLADDRIRNLETEVQRLHDTLVTMRDEVQSRSNSKVSVTAVKDAQGVRLMRTFPPAPSRCPLSHQQPLPPSPLQLQHSPFGQPLRQNPSLRHLQRPSRQPSEPHGLPAIAFRPRPRRLRSWSVPPAFLSERLRRPSLYLRRSHADDSHRRGARHVELPPHEPQLSLPLLLRRTRLQRSSPSDSSSLSTVYERAREVGEARRELEFRQPVSVVQGHARGSLLQGSSCRAQEVQDQRRLAAIRSLHLLWQHGCVLRRSALERLADLLTTAERCLSYDEKPLLLFQRLKEQNANPVFMLRHIKDIKSPIAVATGKHALRRDKRPANAGIGVDKPPTTTKDGQLISRANRLHHPPVLLPLAKDKDKDKDEVEDDPGARPLASPREAPGYCISIYPYLAERECVVSLLARVVADLAPFAGTNSTSRSAIVSLLPLLSPTSANRFSAFVILQKTKGWWVVHRDLGPNSASDTGTRKSAWVPAGCLLETNVPPLSLADFTTLSSTAPHNAANVPIEPAYVVSVSTPGVALMDYVRNGSDELDVKKGTQLRILKRYNHWSYAIKEDGQRGWVRLSLSSSSPSLMLSSPDSQLVRSPLFHPLSPKLTHPRQVLRTRLSRRRHPHDPDRQRRAGSRNCASAPYPYGGRRRRAQPSGGERVGGGVRVALKRLVVSFLIPQPFSVNRVISRRLVVDSSFFSSTSGGRERTTRAAGSRRRDFGSAGAFLSSPATTTSALSASSPSSPAPPRPVYELERL